MADNDLLHHQDEAWQLARSEASLEKKQFLLCALTTVTKHVLSGKKPDGSFDLMFFAQVMTQLYEQKETLQKIFQGDDLRWWEDT